MRSGPRRSNRFLTGSCQPARKMPGRAVEEGHLPFLTRLEVNWVLESVDFSDTLSGLIGLLRKSATLARMGRGQLEVNDRTVEDFSKQQVASKWQLR